MIDTISAYQLLFKLGLTKDKVIKLLEPITRKVFVKDSITTMILGVYGINFSFTVTDTTIRIKGSICKFYNGNNVQTLSYNDLLKAIVKLGQVTRLPVH